jgi:hypothetical protein
LEGLRQEQSGVDMFGGWVFGELVKAACFDACFLQGFDSFLEDPCGEYPGVADDQSAGGSEAFS